MKRVLYFAMLILSILLIESCKIQNAPGAYQPAQGKAPKTQEKTVTTTTTTSTVTTSKESSTTAVTAQSTETGARKSTNVQNAGGVDIQPEAIVRQGLAGTKNNNVVDVPEMEKEEEVVVPTPTAETTSESTPTISASVTINDPSLTTRSEHIEIVEGDKEVAKKMYHVIIGSFGKKENAMRLLEQWRDEYKPVIAQNEKGMYRVVLSSHDEYIEAKAGAEKVRNYIPDVWVLVQLQ